LLFEDQSVDAVFIDAGHDEASVKVDWNAWAPKVKFGGLLCGHDIDMDGVRTVLAEVLPFKPRPVAGHIWALERQGSGWIDYNQQGR